MSETTTIKPNVQKTPDAPKKKLTKKQRIAVIAASVIAGLLVLAVCGGLIWLYNYCKLEDYEIIATGESTDEIQMIAHRGFSAMAPENTAPAFEEAGKAGYWGAECDVYRTKDGVWVTTHDPVTYRVMDTTAFIEHKTYDELLAYNVDYGHNIENYPDLKLTTLDEYLQICREYDMKPIIELKGKNNTEHYDEILASVQKYDMEEDTYFISFHIENLQKMAELTDTCPLWYLVKVIDDEAIEEAKALGPNAGIDFDGNREENTQEMVQKCADAGLQLGAWTIDDPEVMQQLISWGVHTITTNCLTY